LQNSYSEDNSRLVGERRQVGVGVSIATELTICTETAHERQPAQ